MKELNPDADIVCSDNKITGTAKNPPPGVVKPKRETLQSIIGTTKNIVARATVKTDIYNTETLALATQEYFNYCFNCSMPPCWKGLAGWCGYSEDAFNKLMKNEDFPNREYLIFIKDRIREGLEQAALLNAVNAVSAMFILKATHGYVEANKVILEPSETLLGKPKTEEEIFQEVDDLPEY